MQERNRAVYVACWRRDALLAHTVSLHEKARDRGVQWFGEAHEDPLLSVRLDSAMLERRDSSAAASQDFCVDSDGLIVLPKTLPQVVAAICHMRRLKRAKGELIKPS